ncbi:MAG TPA: tRNA (guanosine(37)-N1)-methyltransferase TrmD [Lentisphaeria bacterium]|nr:tRNA (guanosine(37)-N1)-methyltransferase TrmD [Lentisphaeria bacterium]HCG49742.1 tRNA (guanosine(37)-N1)-methyltransferase TrmD [Lentisphaeria bacterium]
MRIDIITLFPEIFFGPLGCSIVGRAMKNGIVEINAVNLRDYTHDRHQTVDDKPFGGGPGMLMKPEPLFEAVEALRKDDTKVILTGPRGEQFSQKIASELAQESHLVIVCGHYEGVDERVRKHLVDREISIGDYILTSGNLPAMVMCDALVRLMPGALGCDESDVDESFSTESGFLEYPQYTRPADFRGWTVPDVLLSGNHALIEKWRRNEAFLETLRRRPDLALKNESKSED